MREFLFYARIEPDWQSDCFETIAKMLKCNRILDYLSLKIRVYNSEYFSENWATDCRASRVRCTQGLSSQKRSPALPRSCPTISMLFPCLAATLGRLRELAGSLGRSWLHGRAGARRLNTQHA